MSAARKAQRKAEPAEAEHFDQRYRDGATEMARTVSADYKRATVRAARIGIGFGFCLGLLAYRAVSWGLGP